MAGQRVTVKAFAAEVGLAGYRPLGLEYLSPGSCLMEGCRRWGERANQWPLAHGTGAGDCEQRPRRELGLGDGPQRQGREEEKQAFNGPKALAVIASSPHSLPVPRARTPLTAASLPSRALPSPATLLDVEAIKVEPEPHLAQFRKQGSRR